MPEISCFYIHFNRSPRQITFIKFDNYFSIRLDPCKPIILTLDTIISIRNLFEMYILSLLVTEDTKSVVLMTEFKVIKTHMIRTKFLYKRRGFMDGYRYISVGKRNPLNKSEPKRESSDKKIRKFIINFNREFNEDDPIALMSMLVEDEIEDSNVNEILTEYYKNNTISLLTGIKKKFGRDIYDMIRSYL